MAKQQDELVFLPLGGCGEIGMNLNLYGFGPPHKRQWIIADIGVTFGDASTPGVDVIMPDISYIEERKDSLLGIVLTHAHEDHMGALARLWPRLKCPVYATSFTMYLVRDRLSEVGLLGEVSLHQMDMGSRFNIGPFDLELMCLTHSIPEPNAVIIRTPGSTVLHTGDWKIDDGPVLGQAVDAAAFSALGDAGVDAIVCDSTNVFSPGVAGSEEDVAAELTKVIGEYKGRRIAVAAFASNVARLSSVIEAARQHERSVCLVGRSMHRMVDAARATGVLKGIPALLDEVEAASMPDGHVLYLCTGSQGEPRAALSRIASGSHRNVALGKGDVVVFSSKIIPGNEKGIFALQNELADQGIEIITEKMRPIHVSGHPCRDELKAMYEWTRPTLAIPVHGERRHLLEHAKLAKSLGAKQAIAPHNGELIRLAPGKPKIIDLVRSGRLHDDGGVIVSADDSGLRQRRKMSFAGHVGVCLVIDKSGALIGGPEPRISGWPEGEDGAYIENLLDEVADLTEVTFRRLTKNQRRDEDMAEEKIATPIRRLFRNLGFKRPIVEVTVIKV